MLLMRSDACLRAYCFRVEVALVDVSGQRDRTGLASCFEKMFLMVCHLWSGSSICSPLPVVQGK